MEMDLTKYSVEELRELQNRIGGYLQNRNDGFIYICEVRSYGNNWKNILTNELSVNDLCADYDGYDGIVDVYTTNPDAKIENYGEVNYIKSQEDYDKWKKSKDLIGVIKKAEEMLKTWENRENIPFQSRPSFAPIWSEQDILAMRNELETIAWTYDEPKPLGKLNYD